MRWADQPVFVNRVQFDRVPVGQRLRAANERDVVVVDDVEPLPQDFLDARSIDEGHAGLLGHERSQECRRPGESVDSHIRMIAAILNGIAMRLQPASVNRMNHGDLVSAPGKFIRQAMHVDAGASEIVRRVERRYHAETQRG
jgi:hypothetical protein